MIDCEHTFHSVSTSAVAGVAETRAVPRMSKAVLARRYIATPFEQAAVEDGTLRHRRREFKRETVTKR